MVKYVRSHLTFKIFLITVALFLAIAAVTYGFIVLYVPRYYLTVAEKMPGASVGTDHIFTVTAEADKVGMIEVTQTAKTFSMTLYKVFLPLLLVVILTALVVSLFYSRYITRPIIRISEASRRLAALDFDVQCGEVRSDELGLLSANLNELSCRLAVALDELKGANALLKEEVEREKELEGRQLAFFSAVSHELKTPITVLKGQLQGMIYRVGGYQDRDRYLRRSFEVACTMEELVMEILTVTRMQSPGFALQRETVDLPGLIYEILDGYEELVSGKMIEVSTDLEPHLKLSVDRRLFAKAISNLISNAYHYSPEGASIHIKAVCTVDGVGLSIDNTGVQIPETEIPGLFEPFVRRERSRNRETGGSGLGLAIVRMVLDLHGFTYHMENIDDGIRFRITG